MKFGIAAFPSKKLQDLVNSYRKRYDSHYSLIPPHLTLKYPFEIDEAQVETIVDKLEEMSTKSQPFTLSVLKVSTFQPVNNVIYLKIDANNELMALHDQLNNELNGGQEEFAYVPHITLGQNLSNDEHSDVFGQLSMLDLRHEETIDRFHLLYQLENGSWTGYQTFHLGKDS